MSAVEQSLNGKATIGTARGGPGGGGGGGDGAADPENVQVKTIETRVATQVFWGNECSLCLCLTELYC